MLRNMGCGGRLLQCSKIPDAGISVFPTVQAAPAGRRRGADLNAVRLDFGLPHIDMPQRR